MTIKERIEKLNISHVKLASLCNCCAHTIRRAEKGLVHKNMQARIMQVLDSLESNPSVSVSA